MSSTDLFGFTIFCIIIGGVLAQFGFVLIAVAMGIVAIITISCAICVYLDHHSPKVGG